jgi:hypothetical protein
MAQPYILDLHREPIQIAARVVRSAIATARHGEMRLSPPLSRPLIGFARFAGNDASDRGRAARCEYDCR